MAYIKKEDKKQLILTLHFSQIQKYNLFLPKTLQLLRMNSVILNWALLLIMKVTNLTILRRQVKMITHQTRANNQMKVWKIPFLKNQNI